jgi:hypothetical protein
MADTPATLLDAWLRRQLSEERNTWLSERLAAVRTDNTDKALHIALGMAPRKLGKADLDLSAEDLAAADTARAGWDPRGWSVDQAARVLILLTAGTGDAGFPERFAKLCRTADVAEAIALYRGLPLYDQQEALEDIAAEGLRGNIRFVFEAVAHNNPFPRERFDEHRWNQMVLKALFIDSTLAPMQGLDARANAELATILSDYAHERWAAGRPVTPELWRCLGPFAEGRMLDDLTRVAGEGTDTEVKAAALALSASPDPKAKAVLATIPEAAEQVRSGLLTWDTLAAESKH